MHILMHGMDESKEGRSWQFIFNGLGNIIIVVYTSKHYNCVWEFSFFFLLFFILMEMEMKNVSCLHKVLLENLIFFFNYNLLLH